MSFQAVSTLMVLIMLYVCMYVHTWWHSCSVLNEGTVFKLERPNLISQPFYILLNRKLIAYKAADEYDS